MLFSFRLILSSLIIFPDLNVSLMLTKSLSPEMRSTISTSEPMILALLRENISVISRCLGDTDFGDGTVLLVIVSAPSLKSHYGFCLIQLAIDHISLDRYPSGLRRK